MDSCLSPKKINDFFIASFWDASLEQEDIGRGRGLVKNLLEVAQEKK